MIKRRAGKRDGENWQHQNTGGVKPNAGRRPFSFLFSQRRI
jgi:hypothetical protein